MSFSAKVKEELLKQISSSRHCQLAELSAMFYFGNVWNAALDETRLKFVTENEGTARKCFTLLKKTFNIYTGMHFSDIESFKRGSSYRLEITEADQAAKLRAALRNDLVTQKSCCRRAYLRGAFIMAGSMSNPEGAYHFEIVCQSEEAAKKLQGLFLTFDIESKIVVRKKYFVLYIKEGSQIVEALNVMEAHVALMEFENSRILKEMRNSVNRRVNCETANISKTVSAAVKQIADIESLIGTPEYKALPDEVKEIAELRIQNPNLSLKELGELCNPVVGKSGVNHRLRKLSDLARKRCSQQ